jgi:hypothetical protein
MPAVLRESSKIWVSSKRGISRSEPYKPSGSGSSSSSSTASTASVGRGGGGVACSGSASTAISTGASDAPFFERDAGTSTACRSALSSHNAPSSESGKAGGISETNATAPRATEVSSASRSEGSCDGICMVNVGGTSPSSWVISPKSPMMKRSSSGKSGGGSIYKGISSSTSSRANCTFKPG